MIVNPRTGAAHVPPAAGPEHYTTYQLKRRPADKAQRVRCELADCAAHQFGWRTSVDENTQRGAAQAHYVRRKSGRKFVELRAADLTVFEFEAGQQCFREHFDHHRTLFLVRGGDWRGNPRQELRAHTRGQDWVEDMATTTQAVADRLARG